MGTKVNVFVPLGMDTMPVSGRRHGAVGANTYVRIETALRAAHACWQSGEKVVLALAPGKKSGGWDNPRTFADLMADTAEQIMADVRLDCHWVLVNGSDEWVWGTWEEVDWVITLTKNWYVNNFYYQMQTTDDFTDLHFVFVSDPGHLPRVEVMTRYRLREWKFQTKPGPFGEVVWTTEPWFETLPADHPPTAWWYEPVARSRFAFQRFKWWCQQQLTAGRAR